MVQQLERGPVVVGVDGSTESYRAIDRGVELAATTGRDVRLVHAWGGPGAAALREELAAEAVGAGGASSAHQLLDVAVAYARSGLQDLGVPPTGRAGHSTSVRPPEPCGRSRGRPRSSSSAPGATAG